MTNSVQSNVGTPTLTLEFEDLKKLRSIIDIAARRGAFSAAEMTTVGTAYNKLDSFLSAAEKAQAIPTGDSSAV